MKKHLSLTISGTVQGVNFRRFVRELSQANEIIGFARNNKDGTVDIVACGEEDVLQVLLEACATGPRRADVAEVVHTWDAHDDTCTYHEFTTH
jgi:acylphosphatase